MITEDLYNLVTKTLNTVHSEDSIMETENDLTFPAELLYSQRMLLMLERVAPESSYILKIAAQCQHLRRWGIPRADYPLDRRGYLQWRRVVLEFQVKQATEILNRLNMDESDIYLITDILKNQGNKMHVNSQNIEDTACLVFLKWYLFPFSIKHESSKVDDILKKTTRKMSERGLSLIQSIELTQSVNEIVSRIQ
jgi:hypothetical protein